MPGDFLPPTDMSVALGDVRPVKIWQLPVLARIIFYHGLPTMCLLSLENQRCPFDHPASRYLGTLIGCLLIVGRVGVISAATPPFDPGEELPQIHWTQAADFVGQVVLVNGRIATVGHTRQIHFLNFHAQRRDVFNLVIFDRHLPQFMDTLESLYQRKIIQVRGMVTPYRDHTQIIVTSPQQIKVLNKLPPPYLREETPLPPGRHFTLATFNVLNLFDDKDDPYHDDETTPAKPDRELRRIATLVQNMNVDILALQEVENRGILERFIATHLQDLGYRHVVLYEGNDRRGIDVCLVSRFPIGFVTSHRHLRFPDHQGMVRRFQRDLLVVQLQPANTEPFEIWVVHLKSHRGGSKSASIRLAEANQIRDLLDDRFANDPQSRILVCGDFNDTFESATLQTILKSRTGPLVSALDHIPQVNRITYNRAPYRQMIDFILWSPAMARDYLANSYKIHYGTTETNGSDHNPVVATFRRTPVGSR